RKRTDWKIRPTRTSVNALRPSLRLPEAVGASYARLMAYWPETSGRRKDPSATPLRHPTRTGRPPGGPSAMSISLRCTGCRSTLKVRDELAGKKVKCPRCQTVLLVPQPEEDALVEATVEKRRAKETKAEPRKPTGRTGRMQREEPVPTRKNKVQLGRNEEPV